MNKSYSTWIKAIKFVLPVLAIVSIVAALGFNWKTDAPIEKEFTAVEKEFKDNNVALEKPSIDVTTLNGDSYSLEAKNVVSIDDDSKEFSGGVVKAEMIVAGDHWNIEALKSVANSANETVTFQNDVKVRVQNEYDITGDHIIAYVKTKILKSQSKVIFKSEEADIVADGFEMTGTEGNRILTFEGNVSGTYREKESTQ